MNETDPSDKATTYQLFMLVLCVLVLVMLSLQLFMDPTSEEAHILNHADRGICAIFLIDFFINLYRAENRKQYFFTWGWIDLISSLPMDFVRIGRLARLLRILRLLRAIRATKTIANHLIHHRAEGVFLSATLLAILMVVFSSIAILHVEDAPESNIKSAEDAMWWSIVTITTVGYGDRFPVTTEGRLLASVLMIIGVGLFGVIAGAIASWFTSGTLEEADQELADLKEELLQIRCLLESQQAKSQSQSDP
ncbi:MAG: potassium channel family protein [Planctomycetaceae bacterium]|nr:potassium channel family protein [Planctomycetaceae bacterium]